MGYFPVRYDSRVVNDEHRGFIRLDTGLRQGLNLHHPVTCLSGFDSTNRWRRRQPQKRFKVFSLGQRLTWNLNQSKSWQQSKLAVQKFLKIPAQLYKFGRGSIVLETLWSIWQINWLGVSRFGEILPLWLSLNFFEDFLSVVWGKFVISSKFSLL